MAQVDLGLITLYCIFTFLLVFVFPKKYKWYSLLISTLLFFYLLVGVKVFFLLFFSSIIYGGGYLISRYSKLTPLVVLFALLPLVLSKVLFVENHFELYKTNAYQPLLFFSWSNLLKITGISYFTFNGISYLLDIKKKFLKPQKNFFLLTLYLFYFPTVFSGPLHRAKYLFNEFKKVNVSNDSISRGLRLILWGLFKNVVIAQRIFPLLIAITENEISGIYYPLVGLLFFLYLYCNFSSFIDFFQGVSQLFNIELKNNFKNRVYLSSSRREFWRGWHITLNDWFRDYFFFAIAKNDKKRKYTNFILLLTFILIALWHELTFVLLVWGILNGLWIILEIKVSNYQLPNYQIRKFVGVMYHLFFSSILALIFIAPDLKSIIDKLFFSESIISITVLLNNKFNILAIVISFLIMDYHSKKAKEQRFDFYLMQKTLLNRWFIYLKLIVLIAIFGISSEIENYYNLF